MRAVVCAAMSGEYFAFQREIRRVTSDMIRLLSGLRAGFRPFGLQRSWSR
ncbi:MAG: hypothetical protein NTX53_03420 [candidate division WOR-3 bacterium]|nr:hypothetical protein [candidate division WOR-3 bacterium]